MRILLIMPEDSLNGAEQYLKMIATQFNQDEVSIYFFKNAYSNRWDDLSANCDLHFLSSNSHHIGMLMFIKEILKEKRKFDYIFTSHVYINSLIGILLSLGLIKTNYFVARESTSIFLRYKSFKLYSYKFAYYFGYRKMNLLICQTQLMYNQLLKNFPSIEKRTKVIVLSNPIDLSGSNQKALQSLPMGFPENYIISAGRLIEEKGYDLLIEAFSKFKNEHPEMKLVILGSGPLKGALVQLIDTLNLKEDVIFAGHVNNVYNYFSGAQLCVVSSRIEGFPNVLLQMMSQNTKVVSTLCAGGIDKIPGIYTCTTNDVDALYLAMEKCFNENIPNRRQMFDDNLKSRELQDFMFKVKDLIS